MSTWFKAHKPYLYGSSPGTIHFCSGPGALEICLNIASVESRSLLNPEIVSEGKSFSICSIWVISVSVARDFLSFPASNIVPSASEAPKYSYSPSFIWSTPSAL